jgi:hypothetical protein
MANSSKPPRTAEGRPPYALNPIILGLVIVLSLTSFVLMFSLDPHSLDANSVYQQF